MILNYLIELKSVQKRYGLGAFLHISYDPRTVYEQVRPF